MFYLQDRSAAAKIVFLCFPAGVTTAVLHPDFEKSAAFSERSAVAAARLISLKIFSFSRQVRRPLVACAQLILSCA